MVYPKINFDQEVYGTCLDVVFTPIIIITLSQRVYDFFACFCLGFALKEFLNLHLSNWKELFY